MNNAGASARDEGIERAIQHAEREWCGWSHGASEALHAVAITHATFTAELVREVGLRLGLPEPPDKRSWGGIFKRASERGWITRQGFEESTNPSAHCRPVSLWRSNL